MPANSAKVRPSSCTGGKFGVRGFGRFAALRRILDLSVDFVCFSAQELEVKAFGDLQFSMIGLRAKRLEGWMKDARLALAWHLCEDNDKRGAESIV